MTSPVLFSTGLAPVSATMRNLVEFKAGKMEMRGKRVYPSDKKGSVYLHQSQDDNLMHFCWKDRQTGVVEDDLILFPDDCEFKRVKECTTGRVYVLKMKSSNRKMFFWLQEPRTDRDDEYCKKINELLNNPPRAGSELGGSSDRDLQTLFGNMTQEQVAQILSSNGVNLASLLNSHAGRSSSSGASASSTTSTNNSAPTSAGASGASPSMNDFRALISGALMEGNEDEANALMAATMGTARDEVSGSGGSGQTGSQGASLGESGESQPLVDLSTAMNSETLAHLLEDEEFLKQIEPHLPPITPNRSLSPEERKKQFSDTVRSSQFRSSLSQFCIALQSGQLGPLMSQFGLNQACVDAASLGNLEAFVRALENQSSSDSNTQQQQQQQQGSSEQSSAGKPPNNDQNKDKKQ